MYCIIFLGPPGAGKGTQAEILSKSKSIPKISTGDILRDAVKNQTLVGKKAKQYLDAGNLVPDEVVIEIIKERIQESDCKNGYILDGFPRNVEQAKALEVLLKNIHHSVKTVISVNVSEGELLKRLLDRAKKENRSDDTEEVIKNRIIVYNQKTLPLLNFYELQNKLIKIDGIGQVENIAKIIMEGIK